MMTLVGRMIVAVIALTAIAGAQPPKRPMTFADLMAMKRVSDPQISPSGKWVMFSVTEVSLEMNTKVNHLWVVPLGDGPEKQITSGTGESFGRFSPDGKFVSYTGAPTKDDPVARITIATWDEANGTVGSGKALTAVSGDAGGAIWSSDSKQFLFTTHVYPECSVAPDPTQRGETAMNGAPRFAGEPATWAEEDACDKAKDKAAEKNPVKAQVWDALLYRHWNAYTGEKRNHVLVMDVDGTNVRDLTPATAVGNAETPTFFVGGPLQYAWAPDSKEIAYVTNLDPVPAASTNNDVFTLRLDDLGAKAVKVSTSPGSDDAPAYSPDGKWLAFRSQARAGFESDKFRLVLFDREKKAVRELMPKFDGWVDEFAWGTKPETIYFASGDRGGQSIFRNYIGASSDEQQITYDSGEYSELSISRDGASLVAVRMRVDQPALVIRLNLQKLEFHLLIVDYGKPVRSKRGSPAAPYVAGPVPERSKRDGAHESNAVPLTHLNDDLLSSLDLPDMEDFWFDGAERSRVQAFVLRPPNFDPSKKYPLKFLIHGGPQGAWGDSWSYRWNAELMAATGYVVVMVNPRGSVGYGQKFIDEVSGDWGGKAYVDLMKGLDAAEAQFPFIDKTRECALGASFGGYMADWILTHTDRFKCIVTHDGLFDPVSAYGETEEMWFPEWEFRRGPATGAAKWDTQPATPWRYAALPPDQDPFRKWSPLMFIQKAKTPTLVIHSQKDYRLDVSQGFELFTALQRLGVPSKFLYFPDEGHWVLRPKNSELWYQVVGDWCDRWTKSAGSMDQGSGIR